MSALQKSEPQPSAAIVPINDSAALMSAVARAAADPSVDVEKMERLFAMHERMEARQAERAYADAMKAAQSEMPMIARDRHNTQTSSDYATLDGINQQIAPIYTRHGFSLSFGTAESPLANHVRVVCTVKHVGGHSEHFEYDNPMDDKGIQGSVNKTPTHARGSAITYARRYLTLMIFNLRTGDDDDGNGANSGVSDEVMAKVADFEAAIKDSTSPVALAKLEREIATAGLPARLLSRLRSYHSARKAELKKERR
jgi:hypothetical protein